MGSERAAIMMNLVPPVGWGEVATRADLVALGNGLREAAIDRADQASVITTSTGSRYKCQRRRQRGQEHHHRPTWP